MARPAEPWRRIVGALLPRSRAWRVAILIVGALVVLALLEPVVGLISGLVALLRAILAPLFATPGGRLLLLNVTLLVGVIATALALRERLRALRAGLVLRHHLDGMAALLRDDRAAARDELKRVARSIPPPEFKPAPAQAGLALARLALRDGDPAAAVRALARVAAAELPAELARSLAQLRAEAWLAQGEVLPEEIEQHLRRALQTWPEDTVLLRRLRDLRAAAADQDEVITLQRRILEHANQRDRARERRLLLDALLAAATGALPRAAEPAQRARAIAWIDEARALAPDDPRPGCLLGDLRLLDGDVHGALRMWGRTRSRQGLDRVADLLQQRPDAITVRELLEACPLDGALLLAARLYAWRGEHDHAVRAARLAARRCGPTPTVVAAVAEILDRCGHTAEADTLRAGAVRQALGFAPKPALGADL